MYTTIKQEAALILGRLAPRGIHPFRIRAHEEHDPDCKVRHLSKCGSLLARVEKFIYEADVFGYAEGCACGADDVALRVC